MSKLIRKTAKIVELKDDDILVLEMCSEDACRSCSAKGLCGKGEGNVRLLELHNDGVPRKVGDEITLAISTSMGLKGAFYAYFLPVAVVMLSLIVMQKVGLDDFVCGISALGVLALYYIVLWIFRDKLEKNIDITIEL